jgi:hypothetical protein
MKHSFLRSLTTLLTLWLCASGAQAAFHVMQIEQVIGGVNGDPTAQAIQLRLRSSGQNLVANSKLWAADATGSNRILLLDISSNVSNSASGARILLSTSAFNAAMIAGGASAYTPDFTLANAMPSALNNYLTAGRLTYEDDGGSVSTPGTIYWSLSWGATYTGPQTGNTTNDADGNFGPSFASALPSSSRQGLLFSGASTAPSTSNSTDYALSSNPATVTRNNGTAFTVVPEPGTVALFGLGALLLSGTAWSRRRRC